MAHRVLIPTPLRPYTDQQDAVEAEGGTVGEVLSALTSSYGELKRHLYADDGKLRHFVNVYVNDDDIRYLERDKTVLKPGDVISIVPSVAGGSPGPATAPAERIGGELSNAEIQRYSRHLILPEVGMDGQRRLKGGRVLCVGAGGLGSPAALYLAAAGVGTIGVIDFDAVDESNLQRQILHGTPDVGRSKLASARDRLTSLNPEVTVETYEARLTSANALDLFRDYDVILDGTDNFATRYLVNDACVILRKPNAYGSIFRFEGQASVFATVGGPCYRCLYPEPPPPGLVPSCAEGGVLGVLPGVIGTIQATEAIKLILGAGTTLVGRLLLYDAWSMRFRELKLRRDPSCPVCGDHPTIKQLIDYEEFCGIRPTPVTATTAVPETTPEELNARLRAGAPVFILDVREPNEFQIARIPGSTLIPLGQLPSRLSELPPASDGREIIVHCKSGVRSAKAVGILKEHGIDAKNLKGGILAWSDRVDPSVAKY
jgi:molybdopterin/thiamine biosynthesis adenylyltransferase/rhodanese-related sulfurtransferase/molybdopterin converting factor small subunit